MAKLSDYFLIEKIGDFRDQEARGYAAALVDGDGDSYVLGLLGVSMEGEQESQAVALAEEHLDELLSDMQTGITWGTQ